MNGLMSLSGEWGSDKKDKLAPIFLSTYKFLFALLPYHEAAWSPSSGAFTCSSTSQPPEP
jgi:hypothetical protein